MLHLTQHPSPRPPGLFPIESLNRHLQALSCGLHVVSGDVTVSQVSPVPWGRGEHGREWGMIAEQKPGPGDRLLILWVYRAPLPTPIQAAAGILG